MRWFVGPKVNTEEAHTQVTVTGEFMDEDRFREFAFEMLRVDPNAAVGRVLQELSDRFTVMQVV